MFSGILQLIALRLHATPIPHRYNQRESRTVLEVLSDFRFASPPLERLLEATPPLRPRYFSAASSPRLRGPGEVHLLVALVSYKTPLKRPRTGLCSGYLAALGGEVGVSLPYCVCILLIVKVL